MPIEYNDRDYFPLKSAAAAIFRRSKVTAVLPHFHAFDELIFVVAGSGRHVVNGAIFDFKAGDVVLVPSGSRHHYRNILCRILALACATCMTSFGVISSEWRIADSQFIFKATLPPNTQAKVSMPAAAIMNVTEAGKPLTELSEASNVKAADGRVGFTLSPGSYQLISK